MSFRILPVTVLALSLGLGAFLAAPAPALAGASAQIGPDLETVKMTVTTPNQAQTVYLFLQTDDRLTVAAPGVELSGVIAVSHEGIVSPRDKANLLKLTNPRIFRVAVNRSVLGSLGLTESDTRSASIVKIRISGKSDVPGLILGDLTLGIISPR